MDLSSITNSWDYILNGIRYTLELTVITAIGGLFIGTILALFRLSTNRYLSSFARIYVNTIRSIPLVLVLFWFFLLMPEVLQILFRTDHPIAIGADRTAIVTFILFESAYFSEIMRSGIQTIKKGQIYAAFGLGLTYWQTMRYVILPQATRNMLPLLLTQTIILFQDTSLVYVINGNDFMGAITKIAQRDGALVTLYGFAAVSYLMVSLSLSLLIRRLQMKLTVN